MEALYEILRDGVLGCSTSEYESLDVNENGIKLATGVPQGTSLEVYDEATGEVEGYYKAIKELWYVDNSKGRSGGSSGASDTSKLVVSNPSTESYNKTSAMQSQVNKEVVDSLKEIIKEGIDDLDTIATNDIERRPYYQKTDTNARSKGLYWYNTDSTETDKWESLGGKIDGVWVRKGIVGGTSTGALKDLPTTKVSLGDIYFVGADGNYDSNKQYANAGDMFLCSSVKKDGTNPVWSLIPSGNGRINEDITIATGTETYTLSNTLGTADLQVSTYIENEMVLTGVKVDSNNITIEISSESATEYDGKTLRVIAIAG